MNLAQVRSLSGEQLVQLGMMEWETKFFEIKMNSFRSGGNGGSNPGPANTVNSKPSEISNPGNGYEFRGEQCSSWAGAGSMKIGHDSAANGLTIKEFLERHGIAVLEQEIPGEFPSIFRYYQF